MKKFLILSCLVLCGLPALCWDGYDWQTGSYVEIEQGNLVRPGNDIEIYDYGKGQYKDVEVQSVSNDEVEVYDYQTDTYRTFDMD